ncbi:hypothetical protein Ais01nite_41260 [Asanoa ishikariensis]|uniref:Protein-glutamine gamma-glutamyltransferase-like C-terminal domain-containing protein n=1 Tax=Asanoa ishikariensis TaxID=137265 RepID=A0A1H3MEZ6_9ACTN|nr:DUF4129 domain-containing protein [Asanoa ishikariensis]GIF66091.1 hypothetical protein Ais01nite_41260 [Asanoa ishikariensis]SDY75216.1 protein of unknown function [Asanoa ishikariensis]
MSGFARWWTETAAAVSDVLGLGWLLLILVVLATAIALLWSHWSRLRRPQLRFRRRRPTAEPETTVEPLLDDAEPDALPDLPAATFVSRADRFAAQGQWAEAVRERLRAVVRLLVDRKVIEHHPGWTVTELASAAGRNAPATDQPLAAAGTVFSDIWYGEKAANEDDDTTMKRLAAEVDRAVSGGRVPASRRGGS